MSVDRVDRAAVANRFHGVDRTVRLSSSCVRARLSSAVSPC